MTKPAQFARDADADQVQRADEPGDRAGPASTLLEAARIYRHVVDPGRCRSGQRPRLFQGSAHRENLRRHEFCRFGTQGFHRAGDQAGEAPLGVLDAAQGEDGGQRLPAQLRRATCKDLGIVCVESGYQVGVGGAAGMDLKETERLCVVETEAEAIDVTVAFVQHRGLMHLDRPYEVDRRTRLDWVKAQVDGQHRAGQSCTSILSQGSIKKDAGPGGRSPDAPPRFQHPGHFIAGNRE